jgi:hypothetical protein
MPTDSIVRLFAKKGQEWQRRKLARSKVKKTVSTVYH